ncbi:hypothetical protein ACHAXR_010891 [Thalassiosira sp. AJA248-18]
MALEPPSNQAFLGSNHDQTEADDFAALDSMAFTGTQSQFGMNTVAVTSSVGSFGSNDSGRIGDGSKGGGFTGVSESLFDRIRARTAEQQKQSLSSSSSQQQQQQQPSFQEAQQSAFMSHQPSSQPTMEPERNAFGAHNSSNNAFDAAPTNQNNNNNNMNNDNNDETTYSFSASAGEDFSQQGAAPSPLLRVPQYGASRDDPYYAATTSSNQQQQQQPTSIQDKASVALAQTGETMKSLWGAGVSGAQTIGGMARDKMAGGSGGGGVGGERSYNNNFLLREDSLEQGNNMMDAATMSQQQQMQQPPPPVSAEVVSGSETGPAVSDQAYSMLKYGKTFCEDVVGFVMQLPPWGRGVVAVVVLYALYLFFDYI